MKTILYAAISINGFIADKKGSEEFLSDHNWKLFVHEAEKTKGFIVGRKTYELFTKGKRYDFTKINAKKIVITKKTRKQKGSYFFVNSPKKALSKAKELGLKSVLIAGGSGTYSGFMNKSLADELIVSIEPSVLGRGKSLFLSDNLYKQLKLIRTVKKQRGIVQLHYKIRK